MKNVLLILGLLLLFIGCTVPVNQPVNQSSHRADGYEADVLDNTAGNSGGDILEDKGDYYLMGGDMILYKDDINHQKIINAVLQTQTSNTDMTRAMMKTEVEKWPGGVIPYFFNDLTAYQESTVRDAMDYIESICNVRFIKSSPTPREYKCYIGWISGGWSLATVGYCKSPSIGLTFKGIDDWGVAVHELLHCLGFSHEHQRYDRNSYIRVASGITEGASQYAIIPQYVNGRLNSKLLSEYDYYSIMHYDDRYITTLDPNMQNIIGQRKGMSFADHVAAKGLYGKSTYRTNYKTGDFDGDGRADILKFDNHMGWLVYRAGSSYSERLYSTNRPTTRWKIKNYIGDFNGDGMDDMMIYEYLLGLQVYRATGTSFSVSTWANLEPGIYDDLVGDFNGDGKDDFAYYKKNFGWYVYLSTGSSFVNAGKWSSVLCQSSYDLGRYKGDFNGDGKDDILLYNRSTGWRVLQSTGSSFTDKIWNTQTTGTKYILGDNVGDFNGDGKDDFIFGCYRKGVKLLLSTGSSFSGSWVIADGAMEMRQVGDLNGDGKDDILGLYSNKYCFYLSTGTNFVKGSWKDDLAVDTIHIDDFDGDGKADLLQYVDQTWWRVKRSTGSSLVRYSEDKRVPEKINTSSGGTGSLPGGTNSVFNDFSLNK